MLSIIPEMLSSCARYSEGVNMSLEMNRREEDSVTILDLRGRLVQGPEATALRERFGELEKEQVKNVILNFKQVDFIDSTGLGMLVAVQSQMEKAGGTVRLLGLSKRGAELMVLTKLSTVFQIFDDEQAAINSFFPGREVKRFDILEFVQSQDTPEPNEA
jgi:anti-sigma B factor antagonist